MPFPKALTGFNRSYANPVMKRIARRAPLMGVIIHRGRKSGRRYETPVLAFQDGDIVTFALTYGSDVDWLKNVLASGSCWLIHRGRHIYLAKPRMLPEGEGLRRIPEPFRFLLRLAGVNEFVEMRRADGSCD